MSTLKSYFTGTAWKYLSAVDATSQSHQHEIGSNKFTEILGNPGSETLRLNAVFVYFGDDDEDDDVLRSEGEVSFYDARRNSPDRSPEFRLYYRDNPVTTLMTEGDFCLVAVRPNQGVLLLITPPGTAMERRVRY